LCGGHTVVSGYFFLLQILFELLPVNVNVSCGSVMRVVCVFRHISFLFFRVTPDSLIENPGQFY